MPSAPVRLVHLPAEIDVNPYTRLLYGALGRFGFELVPEGQLSLSWLWRSRRDVDVLHFHWCPNDFYEYRGPRASLRVPLSWLSLLSFVARLAAARTLGYRVVWTIHEVYPHGSANRRIDRLAAIALARLSCVLFAHDVATADRARAELGRAAADIDIVPHGSYVGFYPAGRPREAVRRELGVASGTFVFLCFGSVKPYKEIERLIEAFRSLPRRDVALVVAGTVRDRRIGDAILAAADSDPRIVPRLGLVPDEGVAELYGAADAAVLPRRDGWTSGSLILALSSGVPVVAARSSAYEELTGGGEAGWFFEPGDRDGLGAALDAAAADIRLAREKGRAALELASRLRWEETAAHTAVRIAAAAARS
jgi:beta-1,4-mannosyltransferase